eukprot:TRINITY_DN3206_c0_g1_i2.p1 TRINITY_DN3206_c0_g1~~TRINITY_DN3206_c0_g1_i2.p1  ORF type:complete len:297 (-),score=90.05 TRINITY_DN3206_c0_g1_i2:69-959(-)
MENWPAVAQALVGTLFTYGCTALGAAVVFMAKDIPKKVMDFFYGFTAGVMISTSCFGLIAPAIDESSREGLWSEKVPWVPVLVGFVFGSGFLKLVELFFSGSHGHSHGNAPHSPHSPPENPVRNPEISEQVEYPIDIIEEDDDTMNILSRNHFNSPKAKGCFESIQRAMWGSEAATTDRFRRTMMLVLAITLHNIPEGVAVGVAFGSVQYAVDKDKAFQSAVALAFAVGIQNIPEGLGVSMPLRREGMSQVRSFFHGQLSGLVEPIGGVLGALTVSMVRPLLPFALSFAAARIPDR